MKKIVIGLVFLSLTGISLAQDKGIKFEKKLSWSQIKTKAKTENKYIFIDVFATWCGPCKMMDKDIYTLERVGAFMNDKFVSISVQGDKTKQDNDHIKSWYFDSETIVKEYQVNGYPTYLFFSPEGKLVHRSFGYRDANEFVKIAEEALNPSNQYYIKVEKYKQGKMSFTEVKELISRAKTIGDKKTEEFIAHDYINSHLLKIRGDSLFTKDNLDFVCQYIGSKDVKAYTLLKTQTDRVNGILGFYQAQYAMMNFIAKSSLPPSSSWKDIKPDWDNLEKELTSKYGALGLEVTRSHRMFYYWMQEDWVNYGKSYKLYFQNSFKHPRYSVNDFSWKLFLTVEDSKIIAFACDTVMKYAIEEWYQTDAEAYDTYANLLHKIGRTSKAIKWEEQAVKLKQGQPDEKLYKDALEKMVKGLPTWNTTANN